MVRAKMAGELEFKIEGPNVSPETVSVGDLAEILTDIYRTIATTAQELNVNKEELHFSLVSISAGSDKLSFTANTATLRTATKVFEAIEERDPTHIPVAARKSLERIRKRLGTHGWKAEFAKSSTVSEGWRRVRISPPEPLFNEPKTRGGTTLLAYIVRAGGEDRSLTASLKLMDGARFTATVASKEVAARMGGLLFQTVELIGEAVWNPRNWKLYSFNVTDVGEYVERDSKPIEALHELSEASGGFWDQVEDLTEYLKSLREE